MAQKHLSKLNLKTAQPVLNWRGQVWNPRGLYVVVFAVASSLLLMDNQRVRYEYELGQPWRKSTLIAPFDFAVQKPETQVQQERDVARAHVPSVFEADTSRPQRAVQGIERYLDRLNTVLRANAAGYGKTWPQVEQLLIVGTQQFVPRPSVDALRLLWERPERVQQLRLIVLNTTDAVYAEGLLDKPLGELPGPIVSLRYVAGRERLADAGQLFDRSKVDDLLQRRLDNEPEPLRLLASEVVAQFVIPNYVYNEPQDNAERQAAERGVALSEGKVLLGQVIVSQGQVVTRQVQTTLRSLEAEQRSGETSWAWAVRLLGNFVVVSLCVVALIIFLRLNRPEIFRKPQYLGLLLLILLLSMLTIVGLQAATSALSTSYDLDWHLAIPVVIAPILITIFFDDRVGFFCCVLSVLLGSMVVPDRFEFILMHSISGAFAVFQLKYLRKRSQFFRMSGNLLITYSLTYLGYQLFLTGDFASIKFPNLLLFVFNMLFTLGTYPLVYLFERLFGTTSNLTYMELLDTDHPLLKELAITAPGTYQHSLQVANIAEEAAKKIGANALLAHVGALFHDIGKLYQPGYFTENQAVGENPHENVSPHLSAQIIVQHVDNGIELARQYKLPEVIVEFIRSHHGTSRVEYFYNQFARDNPHAAETAEADFRYKGPLPVTREQAILMLADSAEAASRSLTKPTKQDLEALVERLLKAKIDDEQFANARITFHDLNKIKREIQRQIISIHHNRISYPDAPVSPPSYSTAHLA